MTENDVRQLVRDWIGNRSYREAGAAIGVSAAWLCQILQADKKPSGKVLDAIGVSRRTKSAGKRGLAFTLLSEHE